MNNKKLFIILVIIVFILIFINKIEKEKIQVKKSLLIASIKEIKELSVIQFPYSKIIKNKKGAFCEITLVLKGYVEGYINLNEIREDDIKIRDNQVYITIPKPLHRFNLTDFNVFKANTLLCDRIALINETIQTGSKIVEEEARKDGIEILTKDRVNEILEKFVKSLGYKGVNFIIKDTIVN